VIIKASVVVKQFKPSVGWRLTDHRNYEDPPVGVKIWEITLDPENFVGYNPFCAVNIIHDRWYLVYANADMTPYLNRRGMVFVDGKPLKQVDLYRSMSKENGTYWVESNGQKVHVRLPEDADPKDHLIEITNREQCFAPDIPYLAYIHIKGLICTYAAGGAPVPQRGSISTCRGNHWIIEDCTIDWSNAVGIDCGNECWQREPIESGHGYHILRGNTINNVGVCGIAALGSIHLLVEDNLIDGTGWQRMELAWESAGIKVHHAKGALFRRNVISRSFGCSSLWLDVRNDNCRITGNLFIDGINSREHIFMEGDRDSENLIDNNIIWNVEGRFDQSALSKESGSAPWYKEVEDEIENGWGIYSLGSDRLRVVNNLIGKCYNAGFFNKTAVFRIMKRGSTDRKHKFFNNIFYDCGEAALKFPNLDNEAEGNVYAKMPHKGGFLRILQPAPNVCLDLDTWQEFYGFDMTGCMGNMVIKINSKTLELTIELKEKLPDIKRDAKVKTDYFSEVFSENSRIAGPFGKLNVGKKVFNIDPRRDRRSV
jgi:hypothetical protein